MDLHADAAQRRAVYRGLESRNRIVSILRIGVPALGAIALVALIAQIYLSSIGARFGVGRITVTSDAILVETPQYAGVFDDGTTYQVIAREATASIDATDQIGLVDAVLTMTRPDGVVMLVEAPESVLDTESQLVVTGGVANVSNSLGTKGIIENSVFDYVKQELVGDGPVTIDYADGTTIVAKGITYDAVGLVWTFSRATVTLPSTPGATP